MSAALKKPKRARQPIYMRVRMMVDPGTGEQLPAVVPSTLTDRAELRKRKFKLGEVVAMDFRRPRSPGFHRLVHRFGVLCAQNIDAFHGKDGHDVIKRVQLEADIGCEHVGIMWAGQPVEYRIPQSIAFDSLCEDEFRKLYRQFADYIGRTYMGGLSAEQVQQLVEVMPDE